MKTPKAMLDSMFSKLDNDLKAKQEKQKTTKSKGSNKNIKKTNSESNVPTETYLAQ